MIATDELLLESLRDARRLTFLDRCHSAVGVRPASSTVRRSRERGPLDDLTDREREVLSLMAEGHSKDGISQALFLSPKTVETHVRHIFMKLDIAQTTDYHRRVLAVLAYLRG